MCTNILYREYGNWPTDILYTMTFLHTNLSTSVLTYRAPYIDRLLNH